MITSINRTDFHIETSYLGIRLIFQPNKGLKSIYQAAFEASISFQLLEIIFLDNNHSIEDIAAILFTSVSTLYRIIREINIVLRPLGFEISTNPCSISGDEDKIRYYFAQYFYEKYGYTEWPFDEINEDALDELLNLFVSIQNIEPEYAFYSVVKKLASVNLVRYKQGYLIDNDYFNFDYNQNIFDSKKYSKAFSNIGDKLGVVIDDYFVEQIFTAYLHNNFSLTVESMVKKIKQNKDFADHAHYLNIIFEYLSVTSEIPLNNKDYVILATLNATHLESFEPHSGHILYNRNLAFADKLKDINSNLYNELYKAIIGYRNYLHRPISTEVINYYIYNTIVFWEELSHELKYSNDKVRVYIVSDYHTSHAKMIKDYLEYMFKNQLDIHVNNSWIVDRDELNKIDSDLIITTFPVNNFKDHNIIYVENVPNFNDLKKIEHVVMEIYRKNIKHLGE